ncbi:MAG TPA: DUF922 domain-containing protein [Bacteroidia bacterium]|nr:DUF922 domain-containing protein [Bacteroidia bacterium]
MKFLYALVIVSLFAFTGDDKKDLILWSSAYKLQWQDFKGNVQGGSTLKAMTWSTIELETKKIDANGIVLNISASFIKNQSWRQKNFSDDFVLKHEQTHFDITEVYARKLRKKLSETKFSSTKQAQQQIQSIYNELFRESSGEQKKYDAETKHSINKEEQEKWNKNIENELQSLNSFTTTEVNIRIK